MGGGGDGGRGRGSVARVSELFYKESISKKNFFEGVGGGWLG